MHMEHRFVLEAADLVRSSIWRGAGIPRGAGAPVLLLPGFMAGDGSLSLMTHWLRAQGYHTGRAGIRSNVDCSAGTCDRIERRLEDMVEKHGQRVVIIGQSRGGILARALAVDRPDLISGIVTLGSPLRSMLSVHPVVLAQVAAVSALGSLGRRGYFTLDCLWGGCCADFRESLKKPFPENVGFLSVYSKSDGIVDWRACLDPHADEHIEIDSSHCGMSAHPAVFEVIGAALARFAPHREIDWRRTA
jgi:pimeloyl-ACP methyl ester carboxylesterase